MKNCNEVEKKTYNRDEVIDLICKLRIVNNVAGSLNVDGILWDFLSREIDLPNDIGNKVELEKLRNSLEAFRCALSRFEKIYLF